jgi:hypothetical protein
MYVLNYFLSGESMANILRFISKKLNENETAYLYLNKFIKIGKGKIVVINELQLKAEGEIKLFGQNIRGFVEIIMSDLEENGECTVILNNEKNNCIYCIKNNILEINHPETKIKISCDEKWTKVQLSRPIPVSIGIKV